MVHPGALSAPIRCILPDDANHRVLIGVANHVKVYKERPPRAVNPDTEFDESTSIRVFESEPVRGLLSIEKCHFAAYGERQFTILHKDIVAEGGSVPHERVHSFAAPIVSIRCRDLRKVFVVFRNGNAQVLRCAVYNEGRLTMSLLKEEQAGMRISSAVLLSEEDGGDAHIISEQGKLFCWEFNGSKPPDPFASFTRRVSRVLLHSRFMLMAFEDGNLVAIISDNDDNPIASAASAHNAKPTALASTAADIIVSGDESGVVAICQWNEERGIQLMARMDLRRGTIYSIVTSGNNLFIGGAYGPLMHMDSSGIFEHFRWRDPFQIGKKPTGDKKHDLDFMNEMAAVLPNGCVNGVHSMLLLVNDGVLLRSMNGQLAAVGEINALPSGSALWSAISVSQSPQSGTVVFNCGLAIDIAVIGEDLLHLELTERCVSAIANADAGCLVVFESGEIVFLRITGSGAKRRAQCWRLGLPEKEQTKITAVVSNATDIYAGTSSGRLLHWDLTGYINKEHVTNTLAATDCLIEAIFAQKPRVPGNFIVLQYAHTEGQPKASQPSPPISRLYYSADTGVCGLTAVGHLITIRRPEVNYAPRGTAFDLRPVLGLRPSQDILQLVWTVRDGYARAVVREKKQLSVIEMHSRRVFILPECASEEEAKRVACMPNGCFFSVRKGRVVIATPVMDTIVDVPCGARTVYDDDPIVGALRTAQTHEGLSIYSASKHGQIVALSFDSTTRVIDRYFTGWLPAGVGSSCVTWGQCYMQLERSGKSKKRGIVPLRLIIVAGDDGALYAADPANIGDRAIRQSPLPNLVRKLDGFSGVGTTVAISATQVDLVAPEDREPLDMFFLAGISANGAFWCAVVKWSDGFLSSIGLRVLHERPPIGSGIIPTKLLIRTHTTVSLMIYEGRSDGEMVVSHMSTVPGLFHEEYVYQAMDGAITAIECLEFTGAMRFVAVGSSRGEVRVLLEKEAKVRGLEATGRPHPGKSITAIEMRGHSDFTCVWTAASDGSFAFSAFHRTGLSKHPSCKGPDRYVMEILWQNKMSIGRAVCIAASFTVDKKHGLRTYRKTIPQDRAMVVGQGMEVLAVCRKAFAAYVRKHGLNSSAPVITEAE